MAARALSDDGYQHDLGDGLRLRWSTAADTDRITQLYSHVFRDGPDEPPNEPIAAWTRDMMSGRHPLITPADFAVVEETRPQRIVAATCLLWQTWDLGGIRLPIGRPEVVATHPDYRRRGLVRACFELIHARSEARGHLIQAITGIPYFYRQFGYEYALDLGGSHDVAFSAIPPLKAGAAEPSTLRAATSDDIPLLRRLYDRERAAARVSVEIDQDYWRYTFERPHPAWRAHLILNGEERPVGYMLTATQRWGTSIPVLALGVDEGISLVAVLPALLRALAALAATLPPARKPDAPPIRGIRFALGRAHPVYAALGPTLAPRHEPPYAWYVRVPDLPGLLRRLAPVLEARLAGSMAAGHDGELRLDFYRGGLRLTFEQGRLTAAEEWRPPLWESGAQAGFPPLVFLQLLFGHRGLDELRHAFPDVWADDEARPLLEVLFPPQPAWVMPLG